LSTRPITPIAFPLLRSDGVVIGVLAKPPVDPAAAFTDWIGECSRRQPYPLVHPMPGARRPGSFVAQAKILVVTFVAIDLPNKLPGRYGATRADQLSMNAVLNFPDATSLPRPMACKIAPALNLPGLLLGRALRARKLIRVEIVEDAAIQTLHVCAVLVDEIAC
jgi:hypothetical protein